MSGCSLALVSQQTTWQNFFESPKTKYTKKKSKIIIHYSGISADIEPGIFIELGIECIF